MPLTRHTAALPVGIVTFVFTDVEDSTGLVLELGDAYPQVIADHRRLVRDASERHGGYEIDSRGDEFFLAFARADDAIETAMLIQQGVTSPAAIEGIMKRYATDLGAVGRDNEYGFGLINPRASLRGMGRVK